MDIIDKHLKQVTETTSTRRLTCILVTDICRYSSLSEKDESSAIRLSDLLFALFNTVTERHGGRVFKRIADGFLAEFPSAQSSMSAALDFLKEVKARNNLAPNAIATEVRVGLHVGDVTDRDDGDIMGHGVNIAARLQEQANPGTILASSNIMNLLGRDFPHKGVKRGSLALKNISKPVTAFQIDPAERSFFGRLIQRILRDQFGPKPVITSLAILAVFCAGFWFAYNNYLEKIAFDERKEKIVNALDEYDQGNELDRRYLSELLHDLEHLPTGDLIFSLLETNKVSDAVKSLKSSLENMTIGDPAYVQTLHFIGALSYQTDPEESQSAYLLILDYAPTDINAMIRLGRVYDVLGHSKLSTELYQRAFDNSYDPQLLNWLENDIAFNQLILGNYDWSLKKYESLYDRIGIDINNNSRLASRIHTNLGVAYYLSGNSTEAKSLALSAIKLQKSNEHYYDLSRSHSLMGFLLLRESSMIPSQQETLLETALFHYKKQLDYAKLLHSPRKIDEANIGLGQIYFKMEKTVLARSHLNLGAMSKNPLHKFEAFLTLSELEWQLKNKTKACEFLMNAKQIKSSLRTNFSPETRTRINNVKCGFSFF